MRIFSILNFAFALIWLLSNNAESIKYLKRDEGDLTAGVMFSLEKERITTTSGRK